MKHHVSVELITSRHMANMWSHSTTCTAWAYCLAHRCKMRDTTAGIQASGKANQWNLNKLKAINSRQCNVNVRMSLCMWAYAFVYHNSFNWQYNNNSVNIYCTRWMQQIHFSITMNVVSLSVAVVLVGAFSECLSLMPFEIRPITYCESQFASIHCS